MVYISSFSMADYFAKALTYHFRAFCGNIFILFLLVSIIDGVIKLFWKGRE